MVIKSETLTELRKNATYSRQYAAALIAHAERIEALIDAEAMVAGIGASHSPAEPAPVDAPAPAPEPARTEAPAPAPEPARNDSAAPPTGSIRAEAPPELPRLELPRPNRDLGVTQADAIKTALRLIGHPASLGEIFNTIKSQRLPVKLTSAENLRLVMSRTEGFESNEAGQWFLKSSSNAEYTDQANASGPGNGSREGVEFAAAESV